MSTILLSGFQTLGDSPSLPIIDYNNIYQYSAAVTKSLGNHTLKWGGSIIQRRMMQFQSNSAKGQFSFDSTATASALSPLRRYEPASARSCATVVTLRMLKTKSPSVGLRSRNVCSNPGIGLAGDAA